MTVRTFLAAAIGLSALAGGPAASAEPSVASAPVSTAQPSVEDQIAAFLAASPAAELPKDRAPGVTERSERQIHGEVAFTVGTNGLRSAYARADVPLGETGLLSVAVEDTRFNGRFGGREHRSLGMALSLGDAAAQRLGGGPCPDRDLDGFGRRRPTVISPELSCSPRFGDDVWR